MRYNTPAIAVRQIHRLTGIESPVLFLDSKNIEQEFAERVEKGMLLSTRFPKQWRIKSVGRFHALSLHTPRQIAESFERWLKR